eukprot:1454679-Rhodomonas_salina.1
MSATSETLLIPKTEAGSGGGISASSAGIHSDAATFVPVTSRGWKEEEADSPTHASSSSHVMRNNKVAPAPSSPSSP